MPLSVNGIGRDCLAHIRLATGGITADQKSYLANTINRALEEMRERSPQTFRATVEVTWTAAKTGTVVVSNGSADMTLGSLPVPGDGCTININTDSTFNEVTLDPQRPEVYPLLAPFAGVSGVQPATTYGDSVVLDITVDRVLGGFLLHEQRPLAIVNSRFEWMAYQGCTFPDKDYGCHDLSLLKIQREPGIPRAVWIEPVALPSADRIIYRARCAPAPNADYRATMDVQTMPIEVSESDLDPENVRLLPVPGGRVYGILRALALYHWSASPWFRNDAARPGITTDYQNALRQLGDFQANARSVVRMAVAY